MANNNNNNSTTNRTMIDCVEHCILDYSEFELLFTELGLICVYLESQVKDLTRLRLRRLETPREAGINKVNQDQNKDVAEVDVEGAQGACRRFWAIADAFDYDAMAMGLLKKNTFRRLKLHKGDLMVIAWKGLVLTIQEAIHLLTRESEQPKAE